MASPSQPDEHAGKTRGEPQSSVRHQVAEDMEEWTPGGLEVLACHCVTLSYRFPQDIRRIHHPRCATEDISRIRCLFQLYIDRELIYARSSRCPAILRSTGKDIWPQSTHPNPSSSVRTRVPFSILFMSVYSVRISDRDERLYPSRYRHYHVIAIRYHCVKRSHNII